MQSRDNAIFAPAIGQYLQMTFRFLTRLPSEHISGLCFCPSSEAILALQVEVSRLKKDLDKGLVQLPHLARKMDYLASKYRQDRQERRSKTKSRWEEMITRGLIKHSKLMSSF